MAARASKIQRTIAYFREADLDEAEVVFTLAQRVMATRLAERGETAPVAKPKQRRTRKARSVIAVSPGQQTLSSTSANA